MWRIKVTWNKGRKSKWVKGPDHGILDAVKRSMLTRAGHSMPLECDLINQAEKIELEWIEPNIGSTE